MGGKRILITVVLATAGVIGLAGLLLTAGDDEAGDRSDGGAATMTSLPARSAAGEYLLGPGAPALRARAASDPIVGQPALTPGGCSTTLEAVGVARAGTAPIATLAAVPDEELATLLLDEDAARSELLQSCAAGAVPPGLVDEVRELDGLVDARLRAQGVQP